MHRIALAIAALWVGAAAPAGGNQPAPTIQSAPAGQAEYFTHPTRGFSFPIPPEARVQERGDKGDISIQSRKGYVIHVQSGDANPSLSLVRMIGKLESQYLGQGKPWSRKLSDRPAVLGALSAHEGRYEGSGSRARVLIARGKKTDFVFMFFAPVGAYDQLGAEFDWILQNFEPAAAEVERVAPSAAKPSTEQPKPQLTAAPVPQASAKDAAEAKPARQTFKNGEFGFSIDYPAEWVASRPSPSTMSFSGAQGTPASQIAVSIQNVQPPAAKSPSEALNAVVGALRQQWSGAVGGLKMLEEKEFVYVKEGVRLAGYQVLLNYRRDDRAIKQWTVVLPRPSGTVVHVWTYATAEDQFEAFRQAADSMLKTWTIDARAG